MTHSQRQNFHAQRGFTLIELMVALVLGLLVIGAAGGIFLQNRRVYGSTEAVNRIQENQRSAFELLTRDIREVAGNPCVKFSDMPIGMLIKVPDATFWSRFPAGVFGADGTGASGSDAVTLYSGSGRIFNVSLQKKPTDPITVVNPAGTGTAGLAPGQPLLICDADHATAFTATSITPSGTTIAIAHDSTGNCDSNLQVLPNGKALPPCGGVPYCFSLGVKPGTPPTATDTTNCPAGISLGPSYVLVPSDAQWTVEANGRNGNSLYRTSLGNRSEIAEGVTSMTIGYKISQAGGYVNAATVAAANAWSQVLAVHVSVTFQAAQGALTQGDTRGTDNTVLTRTLDDYIALRNHQIIQ
ncbi:MAG: prepilin-type N-terminal cleavage/methylation domain-containing protein [Proteobacteria bacterium]|nr:prepilin-type N-terminal cleavage/methylation domain-containing protein [Pseudomonadota bacterium]MBS0218916.1 prepilin-type N-terminal cleavage/methylation domain-containing protein [Pseudomonadota bacterium]